MIVVCSLAASRQQVVRHQPSHVVSILSPDSAFPEFQSVQNEQHLKLSFNDIGISTTGLKAPESQDMERLLRFIQSWDQKQPMLIHCWAGVSRSTAAAYIATCLLKPEWHEDSLAKGLRAASASATPNPLLVALADHALTREGRMVSAISAIGRGENAFEGGPFTLTV
jgi:predicted protein tyrosine phosphatase